MMHTHCVVCAGVLVQGGRAGGFSRHTFGALGTCGKVGGSLWSRSKTKVCLRIKTGWKTTLSYVYIFGPDPENTLTQSYSCGKSHCCQACKSLQDEAFFWVLEDFR